MDIQCVVIPRKDFNRLSAGHCHKLLVKRGCFVYQRIEGPGVQPPVKPDPGGFRFPNKPEHCIGQRLVFQFDDIGFQVIGPVSAHLD